MYDEAYTTKPTGASETLPERPGSKKYPNGQVLFHRRLLTILVMACRIVVPAFSTSFRDSPLVRHTLSAGCNVHPSSFEGPYTARGMLLSRVIRTPLASV